MQNLMRLAGQESLMMVIGYTSSVKFEDSLRLYRRLETLFLNSDYVVSPFRITSSASFCSFLSLDSNADITAFV